MIKNKLFAALLAIVILVSCSDHNSGGTSTATLTGYVAEINSYGQVVPNFTPADMKKAGLNMQT